MAVAYIGLGSNLGNREKHLNDAVGYLSGHCPIRILKASSIMETEPVDHVDQPLFLNQVVMIETKLDPPSLLKTLKHAETALGREKTFAKGPRTIDLDILLYDSLILNSKDLIIPHPEIKNRNFIVRHLVELTPELADPLSGTPYRIMLSEQH